MMIKVAVPHDPYLMKNIIRVPSLFITLLQQRIKEDSELELVDIGNTLEEQKTKIKKNPPDVLLSISASGLFRPLIPFYKRNQTKIILFWDDLHWYTPEIKKSRLFIFQSADKILLPYQDVFLTMPVYKEFHHKSVVFPWWAPMECFENTTPWAERTPKILLSGATRKEVYPIRDLLNKYARRKRSLYDVLPHPGYVNNGKKTKHDIIGVPYYENLGSHQGALATSGTPFGMVLPYVICKTFEVPACGCVPYIDRNPRLDALGFIPDKHYVPVNERNYPGIILKNKEHIAENARKFVLENHSAEVRATTLLQMIKRIL